MKNILIVNLGTPSELSLTPFLLAGLKKKYSHVELGLLCYAHHRDLTSVFPHVKVTYCVDQEQLQKIHLSKIYSDGFGLNLLLEELRECRNQNWDLVINVSANRVTEFISLSLKSKKVWGAHLSNEFVKNDSSSWGVLQTKIFPSMPISPTSRLDSLLKTCHLSFNQSDLKLKVDRDDLLFVQKNLNQIRDRENTAGAASLIGIHLPDYNHPNDLGDENILGLIETMLNTANLVPVLLIAPKQSSKARANSINSHFDNSLVSIVGGLDVLTPVLLNLDCLITVDNDMRAWSAMTSTPTLHVLRPGHAPIELMNANKDDLILAPKNAILNESAFVNTINHLLEASPIDHDLFSETTLYQVSQDSFGIFPLQITGVIQKNEAMTLEGIRIVLAAIEKKDVDQMIESMANSFASDLNDWLDFETTAAIEIHALAKKTQRALSAVNARFEGQADFLKQLDELLQYRPSQSISKIMYEIFDYNLSKLGTESVNYNFILTQRLLEELQKNMSIVLECLDRIESVGLKSNISNEQILST